MDFVLVCKATLSFFCFQIANPTMQALGQDHRNDVFSNIAALVSGLVGKKEKYSFVNLLCLKFLAAKALDGSIKQKEVVVLDPIGAILISLYIIFCWLKQLREQVRNLSGYAAEPEFLQKITWVTLHHSPLIQKIDTVQAFHFGISFLVVVEIILPESMTLKESHDIGSALKEKLESLPDVELAFVRLDYTVDALKY
jgi:divalent metal cation (Fe/Co/Zn/Cd) transporter